MGYLIRKVKPSDLNFVFDSWLKSWRTSKWAGTIPNHLFYDTQRALIEDLIARGATVLVAYPEHNDDVILGWACGETKDGATVLHYTYTKDPFLRLGISERLVSELPGTKPGYVTHWQDLKETRKWRHVPEMARRKSL